MPYAFLYGVTRERNTDQLMASVPRMKHAIRRAEIYARSEVEAILSAPAAAARPGVLMTVYACGLPPIAKLVASALKWENPSTVKDRQSPNARVD